jgi:hypothetical protein
MLKAGIDGGPREPDPVPTQPFAQLREREPATALVIGVDREYGGGQPDQFRILDHSAGVSCQWSRERPPCGHLLSHRDRLSMVIQQARLPLSAPAIGTWPGGPFPRNVISPGRSRIFLHRFPLKSRLLPVPVSRCGSAIVRPAPIPVWNAHPARYATS